MSYHVVDPDSIEPADRDDREFRTIGRAIGLDTLGLNQITAAPGEQIPLKYHYHDEQEEAFYVICGELHVETPDREYVIDENELFIVEPGNPHRAFNPEEADGPVEVLAIGAPSVDDVHRYEP
jgi:mannose-6-phosphate isomerase-like protein (cupin superfamily)